MLMCGPVTPGPWLAYTGQWFSLPSLAVRLHACAHLFEAGRHAPAAGLHDAVVAAHVLADLPVLLTPLLPAGHDRRVAEERRNTVTGQSADSKGGGSGRVGEGGRRGRDKAKR